MKLMTGMVIVAMAASAAAQSASTVQNVRNQLPGSKPAAVSSPKPGPQAVPAPIAKKPVAAVAKPVAPKPVPTEVKKTSAATAKATKPTQKQQKSAEKKASASTAAPEMKVGKKASSENRRDPFVSPVVERIADGGPIGCASGKKCLVAEQLALRGVVRSSSGSSIAVVITIDNRAYFLRENDPIYNGVVTRINENSVTFREQVKDVLGKPATREVVKKINTPA